MDLLEIIRHLHQERERLSNVINSLEELASEGAAAEVVEPRRGRKTMSQAERLEVSRRMRKYWEQRRKQ